MAAIPTQYVFFECSNNNCGLRLPLDTGSFAGHFCPRCGAPLLKKEPGIPHQKPPEAITQRYSLIGALDNIRSIQNVGSIFRTSDGAGVSKLLLGGITPNPDREPSISKTSLGAEICVPWHYFANLPSALRDLKKEGCQILTLESTPEAKSLWDFDFMPTQTNQIVLVVGSEPAGADPAILRISDEVLFIPMAGEKASLNVSVAFGIAAYFLLRLVQK